MKKTLILTALAFALAPVAAFAAPTPAQQASKDCASLRAKMGATAFTQAFGNASNAFGKCVSKFAQAERANLTSANSLCRAEQADVTFAATHGGKTFAQFYGTGKSGKNAFGRCVSLKAKASSAAEQAELNPARTCSALRTRLSTLFAPAFGTNQSHRNAFGKCVSLVARTQSTAVVDAASACMNELNDASFAVLHGGKTFPQFYGTGDLSNAFGNCVAAKVKAATANLQTALTKASKTCRALKKNDPAGFSSKYGTRPNAFAKCVVANAHTK